MKVELILEGGGMRGIYTAGVLDFFMDNKMKFFDITAVSAGVGVATSYLANQRGRTLEIFQKYSSDKRYLSVGSFVKTGSFFGIDFIFKEIPNVLLPFDYKQYDNSGMNLTAVVTNLETGEPEYVRIDDLQKKIDYVIASSSLPIVSRPVEIDNKMLYDGGVADPIPLKHSIANGFDLQVLVLTRNKNYRKSKSISSRIIATNFVRYKNFANVLKTRHNIYNETLDLIDELEKENKVLVLRPSQPLTIDRFEKDINKLTDLYNLGYSDAKEKFSQILSFCKDCVNCKIGE